MEPLDGTAPGPGPTLTPDLAQADGKLKPDPKGFDYVVVDPGINPVGQLVGRPKIYVRTDYHKDDYGFVDRTLVFNPAHWRLYRIAHPLRLQSAPVGIFSDGWIGNFSGYSQFEHAATAAATQSSTCRGRRGRARTSRRA